MAEPDNLDIFSRANDTSAFSDSPPNKILELYGDTFYDTFIAVALSFLIYRGEASGPNPIDYYRTQKMAGRIISQIVIIGTRVVSRAFVEAYKQAQASSKYAAAQGATAGTAKAGVMSDRQFSGLSLSEACSILDVKKPNAATGELTGLTMEEVADRYKRLFDQNDPKKGGSFYLQSKVVRAKERIENQMRIEERKAAEKEAMQPPKMYKE